MVVNDFEVDEHFDGMEVPVARSALKRGTVYDADLAYVLTGAEWPVSGDATTRAGGIIKRHHCPFLGRIGGPKQAVASGKLRGKA